MASSKFIAGLVGPTLIAITASEYFNSHIWSLVTPPITYQAGTMLFVAGLSIVRTHNIWTRGWPVVITILGWIGIVLGLGRMFFPELAQTAAQNPLVPLTSQIILFVAGLFLTVKAFNQNGAA
jgi:cytochrome bd-type quinol oxidase subunit 2